ncbi:MAG: CPBP family intramembrane metalloprotease [Tannerellaceae bacterium]|nr:CPBP family intramembrane metalloprotease [Tannerellaceae bacterium]
MMWRKILYFPFTRLITGVIIILALTYGIQEGCRFLSKTLHIGLYYRFLIQHISMAVLVPLGYVLFYRWYEKRKITELTMQGFFRQMGAGLLTGFVFMSAVMACIALWGVYRVNDLHIGSYLLLAFAGTVSTGVIEEILLRGMVFRLVEEKLGTWLSLLISAFLFGFLHIWNDEATVMSSVAISLEAGVLLATAYIYTRNLWFPIFLHAAWNFTCGDIYGAPVSGYVPDQSLFMSEIGGPEWLTGGGFGPENAVQTVLLGLLSGALFMIFAYRKQQIIPLFRRSNT